MKCILFLSAYLCTVFNYIGYSAEIWFPVCMVRTVSVERFHDGYTACESGQGCHHVTKMKGWLDVQHFETNEYLINGVIFWLGTLVAAVFSEGL